MVFHQFGSLPSFSTGTKAASAARFVRWRWAWRPTKALKRNPTAACECLHTARLHGFNSYTTVQTHLNTNRTGGLQISARLGLQTSFQLVSCVPPSVVENTNVLPLHFHPSRKSFKSHANNSYSNMQKVSIRLYANESVNECDWLLTRSLRFLWFRQMLLKVLIVYRLKLIAVITTTSGRLMQYKH